MTATAQLVPCAKMATVRLRFLGSDPKKGWERGGGQTAKGDRDRANQISFFCLSHWGSWEGGGRREDINVSAKRLTFTEEEGVLCLSYVQFASPRGGGKCCL